MLLINVTIYFCLGSPRSQPQEKNSSTKNLREVIPSNSSRAILEVRKGKIRQTIKVVFKQIMSVHNQITVLRQTAEASVEHILELPNHSHCLQVLLGRVQSQPLPAYSTESKPLSSDKDMKMEVQPHPVSWGTSTICYKVIANRTTFTMITIVKKKFFTPALQL